MSRPLVIYGAGGLGREVRLLVRAQAEVGGEFQAIGFVDDESSGTMLDLPILGGFDRLAELASEYGDLAVVVAIGSSAALEVVSRRLVDAPFRVELPNLVHPSASVDTRFLDIGVGNVFCAGARVNNGHIGSFNIINMNTVLGHDVRIGDFSLISPSATVNGEVTVGTSVLIGAGATIMPRLAIGDGATVALGSVVGRSVPAGAVVAGNPARVVKRGRDPS